MHTGATGVLRNGRILKLPGNLEGRGHGKRNCGGHGASSVVARASRPCESCHQRTGETPVPLPSESDSWNPTLNTCRTPVWPGAHGAPIPADQEIGAPARFRAVVVVSRCARVAER